MGQYPSKEKTLYKHAKSGNIPAIKALRNDGAGLEWIDNQGRTPLIAACHMYDVTKTLIQLGADINACRPGYYGTALHHAARRGHRQIVNLLLSHGANALIKSDNGHTPLDVARAWGHSNVVKLLEEHVCLFAGWLREPYGPGFLDYLAPNLLSRRVWVNILPCGSFKLQKPKFNLNLVIYSAEEDARPRTIIPLSKANFEEPDFSQADPVAIITDISRSNRIKLAAAYGNDKEQLQRFCNACKGIPPPPHFSPSASTVAASYDEETYPSEASTSKCELVDELATDDGPIDTPSSPAVDVAGVTSTSSSSSSSRQGNEEEDDSSSSSSCTICLDAPVEVACIPCGHMAGCMSCMNELRKGNEWACPVCRANIDRVIWIYAV